MMIGKLDKRITITQPTKTDDGQGGKIKTWTTVATVWAQFKIPKVTTDVATGTVLSDLTWEIGIRYRTDILKGWKVSYGIQTFEVMHVYSLDRDKTTLICREVVK